MTERPEINFARRLVAKYGLEPPIDVEKLVKRYATLTYASIPFEDVDGICLDLKVKGKLPHVVVNKNNPLTRQRFTLAHELGHVIIPWHIGLIIDRTEVHTTLVWSDYWTTETEANAFAAELLMPSDWISSLTAQDDNLARIHRTIFERCNTSPLSSAIHLAQRLPSGIVYVAERDGTVEFSGRTEGTIASALPWGSELGLQPYLYSEAHYEAILPGRSFHWWKLPQEIEVQANDDRSWREILDQILAEIGIPPNDLQQMKMSINGVIASANSTMRRSGKHTVGGVVSASIQRFRDRAKYSKLVAHPKFETLIVKRAQDLTHSQR